MIILRYISLLFLFCCLSTYSSAQRVNQLYFMNSLAQASHYNPAAKMRYKLTVSFPALGGINYQLSNKNFNFNSVFTKLENGKYALDTKKLLESASSENPIYTSLDYELFGVYVNTKKLTINVSIRDQVYGKIGIPYDLIGLPLKGSAHDDYLGQKVNIAPDLNVAHYRVYSVGGSYLVNDKLNVGLNFKTIVGLGAMLSEGSEFSVRQDDKSLQFETFSDIRINTSGTSWLLDKDEDVDIRQYATSFDNLSFSVDLGITYQLNEKLSLQASALNLGPAMQWGSGLASFNLSPNHKSLNFKGIDPFGENEEFSTDEIENFFKDIAEIEKNDDSKSIETRLPMQFFTGARYDFGKQFYVSSLAGLTIRNEEMFPSLGVATHKEFGEFVGLGLSYLWDDTGHNVGSMFSLGFPGFKVYLSSENALTSVLNFEEANAIDFRAGVNLNFGSIYRSDKQEDKIKRMPRFRFKKAYPNYDYKTGKRLYIKKKKRESKKYRNPTR